jgi:hypothetical protein
VQAPSPGQVGLFETTRLKYRCGYVEWNEIDATGCEYLAHAQYWRNSLKELNLRTCITIKATIKLRKIRARNTLKISRGQSNCGDLDQ